jgi:tetratricopeptide (TPR) repeat protein
MPKKVVARRKLSRREQRDLKIEIGFMEGIIRRDPHYVDALQILGDDYTKCGRFDAGLEVDERLALLRPTDPLVLYNLSCSYSLLRRYADSASVLERAIENGYIDFNWLRRDPDLRGLRRSVHFKKIKARILGP